MDYAQDLSGRGKPFTSLVRPRNVFTFGTKKRVPIAVSVLRVSRSRRRSALRFRSRPRRSPRRSRPRPASLAGAPPPTPTPTPTRFLEEAAGPNSSSSVTTFTPSGLAAADANLARVLFLAAPTESTSPVFCLTTRRTACAHAAACAPSEHPEGNCTYASSMDAFSTTTPRRAFEGERSGDSADDASRVWRSARSSVLSRTSAFRNPQTRSSVSFISLERSTRCIALDALSYGR
mmetsp:Transcript_13485/g.56628  ORF Transcript_13485/g.56628 Transcript_13485/m.56628 type:complete len:234 (+) Transcript_13485:148-849(+)